MLSLRLMIECSHSTAGPGAEGEGGGFFGLSESASQRERRGERKGERGRKEKGRRVRRDDLILTQVLRMDPVIILLSN